MSEATPPRPSWRIVASDDDPSLLAQITHTLREAGHTVFAAYNGHSAHHLACNTPDLDLFITNSRIRGMSAAALIRQVRAYRPGLAILHIGEPLPRGDLWDNVPSLREPVASEVLLGTVAELLDR